MWVRVVIVGFVLVGVAGCGDETTPATTESDAGIDAATTPGPAADAEAVADAGTSSETDAGADAQTDAGTRTRVDAGADAGADASIDAGPLSAPPHGRLVPFDLSRTDEDTLLGPGGTAAIYAVGDSAADFHPEREPLILVHGIQGAPSDLQAIATRVRASTTHQLYILAYNDYHRRTSLNGLDFGEEFRALASRLGTGRPATIVGHSMGGIVARQALNDLAAGPSRGVERFSRLRLFAVDTPWHGFFGPSDNGIEGIFMKVASVFMPDGLEDMRAKSAMFQGDPRSTNPALRAGLLNVTLPAHVTIGVVFAESGTEALDYTEDTLAVLPDKLVAYYRNGTTVTGGADLENFWKALRSAERFAAFDTLLRTTTLQGGLGSAATLDALKIHYPKFPGDHMGVIAEHPGRASFIDHLAAQLAQP